MTLTREDANEIARIIGSLTMMAGQLLHGSSHQKKLVEEVDALERLAASAGLVDAAASK